MSAASDSGVAVMASDSEHAPSGVTLPSFGGFAAGERRRARHPNSILDHPAFRDPIHTRSVSPLIATTDIRI